MSDGGPTSDGGVAAEGATSADWAPPSTPAIERLNEHLNEQTANDPAQRRRPAAGRLSVADTTAVFARVVELADTADVNAVELTHRQVGEIADEVGVSLEHLATVLAEGLVVSDEGWSLSSWLIGPAQLSGVRSASRSEEDLEADLLVWLKTGHGLRPRMTSEGLIAAERRRGAVGALGRRVLASQDFGGLGEARGVRAAVVEAADDASAVCLVVDVGDFRRSRSGAAIAIGGSLVAGAFTLLTPLAAVGIPASIGAGVIKARSNYKARVRTVERDLQETLDGVAIGTAPPVVNLEAGRRLITGLKDARDRRTVARQAKGAKSRGLRRK